MEGKTTENAAAIPGSSLVILSVWQISIPKLA